MNDLRYSRPAGTALRLGDDAPDRHRFLDKRVLLTIEKGVEPFASARAVLLDSLRLLVRTCRNVVVAIPAGSVLVGEVEALLDEVAFGQRPRVVFDAFVEEFDAVLNVGTTVRPELPWTVISADGWLARVSSGRDGLPVPTVAQVNPVSVLAAASLGVTEVFKRLIGLKPGRGALLEALSFSLLTLEVEPVDSMAVGPLLPEVIEVDGLVLFGVGAIGNGNGHILRQLPLRGRVFVVDRQAFGEENLGTCIMIGPRHINTRKAVTIAEMLRARGLDAFEHDGDIESYKELLAAGGASYPRLLLNGLDNVDARHEAQELWPDVAVDGAIGDFMCQASRHAIDEDVACLRCVFIKRGENAMAKQARATGLTPERLLDPESPIKDEDIARAPEALREFLRARRGTKVCAVVSEAVLAEISTMGTSGNGFAPSAPFVACLSAAMCCAEVLKQLMGIPSALAPRVQLDVLHGPALGMTLPQGRSAHCDCVARRRNIDRWREQRVIPVQATGER